MSLPKMPPLLHRWLRVPDTVTRLSIGVSALVLLCLMTIDSLFGLVADPAARESARRMAVSQTLADQLMISATRLGEREVIEMLNAFRRRETQARAIALRSADGEVPAASGLMRPRGDAQVMSLDVPVMLQGRPWGALELQWTPIPGESWPGRLWTLPTLWPLLAFVGIAALLRLYLGRVLRQLDPDAAVPDRVRSAYDTLTEGVLILDDQGRILLMNKAVGELTGRRDVHLGRQLEEHGWFADEVRFDDGQVPWQMTLDDNTVVERRRMTIGQGERQRIVLVTCSPVGEAGRRRGLSGCLVVLADQTSLERAHDQIARAMRDLQSAHEQIRLKNEELFRLATRDPMTGCLNRRAFFEQAGALKERCNLEGRPVAAVMCDIDHFKSFNDRYGHAIGDEVIKAVAGIYNGSAREADLVCRYGGEEFCVLLPDCEEAVALAIADTLRRLVQDTAGDGIDHDPRLTVTSSFGVAVTRSTRVGLEALIDQADQALYQSKRNGRNRCTLHEEKVAEPA